MKEDDKKYKAGDFLYKIPDSLESMVYNPENERVFIYNGQITGDGYGMLIGWHDGQIVKSTGFANFCWGANVRYATKDEIHKFMIKLMSQDTIKNY